MFQFQCNIPENSCLNWPLIHVSFEERGHKGLYLKCVFPTQYIFYHLLLTIFLKIRKQPNVKYSQVFVSVQFLKQPE